MTELSEHVDGLLQDRSDFVSLFQRCWQESGRRIGRMFVEMCLEEWITEEPLEAKPISTDEIFAY